MSLAKPHLRARQQSLAGEAVSAVGLCCGRARVSCLSQPYMSRRGSSGDTICGGWCAPYGSASGGGFLGVLRVLPKIPAQVHATGRVAGVQVRCSVPLDDRPVQGASLSVGHTRMRSARRAN